MHSSAPGAAARMISRSACRAARLSSLTRDRYSSIVVGLSVMARHSFSQHSVVCGSLVVSAGEPRPLLTVSDSATSLPRRVWHWTPQRLCAAMASTTSFSDNLRLVLKLLSMSAAKLASELAVDKSVVSRWLNGSVQPSAHNLSRLSALVAGRLAGFRALDCERTPDSLAEMFGADPGAIANLRAARPPNG